MQTSVRSNAPRPADTRNLSDEFVRVCREVSVVSSQAPTPSTFPSIIQEHVPTGFGPGVTPVPGSGSQLKRWNSRLSDASWRYSRRTSWQAPRTSQDASLLHSNRESMKALSDFLMTREPPPTNFMSIPSDEAKLPSSLKERASRLFGKLKNQNKSPRLMKLPDSVVAAQTRSGSRHIAISIPMENVLSRSAPPLPSPNPLRSNPPPKVERGAVTVLKPVAETVPEKQSREGTADSGTGHQKPELQPDTGDRSLDAAQVIKAYEMDADLATRRSKVEQRPAKHDPQRFQRSYVAVSPVGIDQLNSQRPASRMSDGTIYSQMSLASTGMGHSRNISSISTAPSATLISALPLDLPLRTSSIPKLPTVVQKEHAIASKLTNNKVTERLQASPTGFSDTTGTSPSPSAIYGIAVRGYNVSPVGRPQVIKNMTSRSLTSISLPSPPEDRSAFIPRPATAPPTRTRKPLAAKAKDPSRRVASKRDGVVEPIFPIRQTRQERVRARKLRDIESVSSVSGSGRPLSELKATNISHIVAPPRNPKRRTNSPDARRRATINTLSPIMLVASLHPYTGFVTSTNLRPIRSSRQSRSVAPKSPESPTRSTHTPPRSIITSLSSDTDTDDIHDMSSTSATKKRRSRTLSLRSSMLETRRQSRRAKRNMSLHEREMDARLSKIESDNIMLLQTLGEIVQSFGEISRIGEESRQERRTARLLDEEWKPSEEEKRRRGELEKMEHVMRDMRTLAPSVSMEIHEQVNGASSSEDSYDGLSVMDQ